MPCRALSELKRLIVLAGPSATLLLDDSEAARSATDDNPKTTSDARSTRGIKTEYGTSKQAVCYPRSLHPCGITTGNVDDKPGPLGVGAAQGSGRGHHCPSRQNWRVV